MDSRSLLREHNHQTSDPRRKRARADEDFDRTVASAAENATHCDTLARFKKYTGQDGTDDCRDSLEDRRARDSDARVFGLAAGAVERSVWPGGREATTLY